MILSIIKPYLLKITNIKLINKLNWLNVGLMIIVKPKEKEQNYNKKYIIAYNEKDKYQNHYFKLIRILMKGKIV